MAQIDTKSTIIDGVTYKVAPLDPFVANDILIDIGHVLGPSIGALAAIDEGAPDPAALNEAIGGLFQRLEKDTMRSLIGTLAEVTEVCVGGGRDAPQLNNIMTLHFRGKLGTMYQWLWFALKVQFEDFFALAAPAIARAGALVGAASDSPDTSQIDGLSID